MTTLTKEQIYGAFLQQFGYEPDTALSDTSFTSDSYYADEDDWSLVNEDYYVGFDGKFYSFGDVGEPAMMCTDYSRILDALGECMDIDAEFA